MDSTVWRSQAPPQSKQQEKAEHCTLPNQRHSLVHGRKKLDQKLARTDEPLAAPLHAFDDARPELARTHTPHMHAHVHVCMCTCMCPWHTLVHPRAHAHTGVAAVVRRWLARQQSAADAGWDRGRHARLRLSRARSRARQVANSIRPFQLLALLDVSCQHHRQFARSGGLGCWPTVFCVDCKTLLWLKPIRRCSFV